ncbi:MAG TPA: oligosaccharide flippase family protein [Candidatus Eisenbacteria bacterium]|nr:oligosaccharide flippase family protein [Candidatus Eisenbacteria bacterium]
MPIMDGWRQTRGGRIVVAVSSGAAARTLSSLLTLVSLPLAVRYLGAERFGLWATITSTVVFLNLLDFGVAGTLTNHIAHSYAVGDWKSAARYTTNALTLTVAMVGLAGLALATAWSRIDWMKLLNVGTSVPRGEVTATVAAAAGLMLLGLPASLSSRIFAGYQEVQFNNLVIAVATVANLVGLLTGIVLRVPMPALFLMAAGGVTLCNLAALAGTLLWYKPWLRPQMTWLAWPMVRELLSSGSGFFLIQVAGAVVFSSDNVVVSHYLGAAQVTPYNVTWRLVGLTAVMQSLLFPALWPAFAEAYAGRDYGWMRRAFRLTMWGTVALNSGFAVALMAVGKPVIRWWAGEAAVPSTALLAAMALWSLISGCMTVESCLLAAVNRTREQGVFSVLAAALNLVLSIVLVQRIGAVGVISGTILSYLLVLIVPQSLIARSVLRVHCEPAGLQCSPQPMTSYQPQ